jgi:hypothetical protein
MTRIPGIAGSLMPGRYVADRLLIDAGVRQGRDDDVIVEPSGLLERRRRRVARWWQHVSACCGPATGLRAIVDIVAMPLFGLLGFRATGLSFDAACARIVLRAGTDRRVVAIVLPWARQASVSWRNAVAAARAARADWSFVLAPPFLSLIDARGHATRRSIDVSLSELSRPDTFTRFWILFRAATFEDNAIAALVGTADAFQDRVRADLQEGVLRSIVALQAVVSPASLSAQEGQTEALTLVYRILFLLFAESRRLLPVQHPTYAGAYAMGALCRDAIRSDDATGLWDSLAAMTRLSRAGCRTDDLIVRPFNGALFAKASAPSLERPRRRGASSSAGARDLAIRTTLVALASRSGPAGREEIGYDDLGVEQLGAVYERVLDVPPGRQPSPAVARATPRGRDRGSRQTRHADRRKQSGTFYTPRALAEFVVRRTLAPLVEGSSADRILALRVVDPAMGSGAFLVAACRFLAAAYARALVDEGRCGHGDLDVDRRADIRRLIAERCLFGVDLNPTAVQLARLSLWLTTLAQGKPLGFLDHRLRIGNSLIGASPDDLARLSAARRGTALPLFEAAGLEEALTRVARPLADLVLMRDDTVDAVHTKTAAWRRLTGETSPLAPWRVACDLWCARWLASGSANPPSPSILRAAFDALLRDDRTLRTRDLDRWIDVARATSTRERPFHWTLEFPDVFYDAAGYVRDNPGFDAVIGNPPWEMLRNDDGSTTGVAHAGETAVAGENSVADRGRLLRFVRDSGLYESCRRGHLNLYQPFVERALAVTRRRGRVGLVLPWSLATDDGAEALRRQLIDRCAIDTIVGLDNAQAIFPIHRGLRFLVLVASPGLPTREIRCRLGVRTSAELDALPAQDDPLAPEYPIRLSRQTLTQVGGSALRFPDIRRPVDLDLLRRLTADHPPIGDASGFGARFGRELNATEDRAHFGDVGLPVVEGKHVEPFRTDVGSSRARVRRDVAARRLSRRPFERARLAYRDVSGVGNQWTLIAAVLPADVVTTHTLFCLQTPLDEMRQHYLCGVFNSFVLNAVVRMLMGGHVTTSLVEGLPVPVWRGTALQRRIARIASRLREGSGKTRAARRASLHAAVARLYDLDTATFAQIVDGFPIVPDAERRWAVAALGRRSAPQAVPAAASRRDAL